MQMHRLQRRNTILSESPSSGNYFDSNNSSNNNINDAATNANDETSEQDDDESSPTGQANTRFSKFAPDPNLETSDFREQLRVNMIADVERRRSENPKGGSQLAKDYLDSL